MEVLDSQPHAALADIRSAVRAEIQQFFGIKEVPTDTELTSEHIGEWDSLAHAQLIVNIEDQFGVRFDDAAADQLQGLERICAAVFAKRTTPSSAPAPSVALSARPDAHLPVLVLGDSSVRTFSFSECCLTLQVAGSATTNFSTETNAAAAQAHIHEALRRTTSAVVLPFFYGGIDDASHMETGADAFLNAIADRKLACLVRLSSLTGRRFVVGALRPEDSSPRGEINRIYHRALQARCKRHGLAWFPGARQHERSNGWQLDRAHFSDPWGRPLLEAIGGDLGIATDHPDYFFRYKYTATWPTGNAQVHGDASKDELYRPPPDVIDERPRPVRQFARLHSRTVQTLSDVSLIADCLKLWRLVQGRPANLATLNAAEGLVPFQLQDACVGRQLALDLDARAIRRAGLVGRLLGVEGIEFAVASRYAGIEALRDYDCAVILDHLGFGPAYYRELYGALHGRGLDLILRCEDLKSSAVWLREAGYEDLVALPDASPLGLSRSGTVERACGRQRCVEGSCLVVAVHNHRDAALVSRLRTLASELWVATRRAVLGELRRLAQDAASI